MFLVGIDAPLSFSSSFACNSCLAEDGLLFVFLVWTSERRRMLSRRHQIQIGSVVIVHIPGSIECAAWANVRQYMRETANLYLALPVTSQHTCVSATRSPCMGLAG